MLVVSVVGLKKTGKTTVVEALVAEFKRRGMAVAALKCMPHGDFTFHPEGKDTRRHSDAGADVVLSASDREIAVVRRTKGFPDLDAIVGVIGPGIDVLVCEGLPFDFPGIRTVLTADSPRTIAELLEVRGKRSEVVAVSGIISNVASTVDGLPTPVVNVMVPGGAARLADLLLG